MLALEVNRGSFLLIAISALLVAAFTDSIAKAERPTPRTPLHKRYNDDDYEEIEALSPRRHYLGPPPIKKFEHPMEENRRMRTMQPGPVGYPHQNNLLPGY